MTQVLSHVLLRIQGLRLGIAKALTVMILQQSSPPILETPLALDARILFCGCLAVQNHTQNGCGEVFCCMSESSHVKRDLYGFFRERVSALRNHPRRIESVLSHRILQRRLRPWERARFNHRYQIEGSSLWLNHRPVSAPHYPNQSSLQHPTA